MTDTIEVKGDQIVSHNGPNAVNVFAMRVLASALRLYAGTGVRANSAYTPKAMLDAAERWTGKKFKGKLKYHEAAKAVALAADDLQREKVTVVRS